MLDVKYRKRGSNFGVASAGLQTISLAHVAVEKTVLRLAPVKRLSMPLMQIEVSLKDLTTKSGLLFWLQQACRLATEKFRPYDDFYPHICRSMRYAFILVSLLIIGIVYREQSALLMVPFPAESSSTHDTSAIFVLNPAKNIESPVTPTFTNLITFWPELRTREYQRHRFSGFKFLNMQGMR